MCCPVKIHQSLTERHIGRSLQITTINYNLELSAILIFAPVNWEVKLHTTFLMCYFGTNLSMRKCTKTVNFQLFNVL